MLILLNNSEYCILSLFAWWGNLIGKIVISKIKDEGSSPSPVACYILYLNMQRLPFHLCLAELLLVID